MKTKLALILLAPAIVFAAPARPGGGPGSLAVDRPLRANCLLSTLTPASPTTLSAVDLVAAVEEERMARDVYVAAAAKWNLSVFAQIAQSEAQHEAALVRLAATANMTLPPAQPGVYSTADLQQMHTSLMALVIASPTGALRAAALIEETDISDLRRIRATATDEPTRAVLANLERASGQHLRAFVRNLGAQGIIYAPQVLAADDYLAVIGPPDNGRGMRRGSGCGGGNGAGLRTGLGAGFRGGR